MKSKNDSSSYDILCKIFDGILNLSNGISDLKFLFALEHPEVFSLTLFNFDFITLLLMVMHYYLRSLGTPTEVV